MASPMEIRSLMSEGPKNKTDLLFSCSIFHRTPSTSFRSGAKSYLGVCPAKVTGFTNAACCQENLPKPFIRERVLGTGLRLELPINPGSFSLFAHIRLLRCGLRQGSKGVITKFFAKGPGNIGFVTANIIYQIAIYVGETARTSY
jgi:hypothetical protein